MTEAQRDDPRSHFEDFDGEYYRLTISVAKNENGTMFYNIGKIKKENAAQELPRGVTVSGSLADATSAASTNSIRQEGQKSQGGFLKNRASHENCKSSNLHRARKKAASRLLFGDPLEVTNGLLTRKNAADFLLLKIKEKVQKPVDFRTFLVTRWRFELQTHCLKGNCSAN